MVSKQAQNVLVKREMTSLCITWPLSNLDIAVHQGRDAVEKHRREGKRGSGGHFSTVGSTHRMLLCGTLTRAENCVEMIICANIAA